MPAARTLISELLNFARGAPASSTRDSLIRKAETFQRVKRAKPVARPPRGHPGPDRLQGIVAAISYLLLQNKSVTLEEFCSSLNTRNNTLQQ